jgi:hypothetical protein
MKKTFDLSAFKNILPYDSEIFGIYQPLLGWQSKKMQRRIIDAYRKDMSSVLKNVTNQFKGAFEGRINTDKFLDQQSIRIAPANLRPTVKNTMGSFVIEEIGKQLPPEEAYNESLWDSMITSDRMQEHLERVAVPQTMEWYKEHFAELRRQGQGHEDVPNKMAADQLNKESVISGYLIYLKENKQFDQLKDIFYDKAHLKLNNALQFLKFNNPLDTIDPQKDIDRVGLSPIGIVHLFRQYFFEFDTFLGTPVNHVWMSPGSSVELVEISTRKTIVERTMEIETETTVKTEKEITEEDELSNAVKDDNKSDTSFGANGNVHQGWIGGSADASSSININNTQQKAREETHKHMRKQTEKLSTEIRNNFKSTFKTITETTDTSSKRYVLANNTPDLINYELRRKMRQVGVQVQDIGTYLCWQTYVDDPGRQLGISKLVHLAKSPEIGQIPPPQAVPYPQDTVTQKEIAIPFVQTSEDRGDLDEQYDNGKETDEDFNEGDVETIQANFPVDAQCDQPGYEYAGKIEFEYGGNDVELAITGDVTEDTPGNIKFTINLKHVNFKGNSPIRVMAKVHWRPTKDTVDKITNANDDKIKEFNEQALFEYKKEFVNAARERIKIASKIESRKFEDLREEERIVVYRSLIQDMLTQGIPMPDDKTRHVVAELLNTIFDIDKMLYFVAPEWWRPRLHQSHQSLGGMHIPKAVAGAGGGGGGGISNNISIHANIKAVAQKSVLNGFITKKDPNTMEIPSSDVIGWGGLKENREDNYYITEESAPAKLGSSLGWLLQLDGDDLRNAFLNAPWVKAVIPIRPGKELAAINWLQRVHVEGSDGLDSNYVAPQSELNTIRAAILADNPGDPHSNPAVPITIRDAINDLCRKVAQKHKDSMKVERYPMDEINDDNKVSATPIDKVYEHGFYPLQGGFRAAPNDGSFEIFDQWVEILPTDQIVPVEVKYDPKTGRQL